MVRIFNQNDNRLICDNPISRTYPASYYKVSYAFGKNATLVEFLMIDTILLCGNTRDITEGGFFDMILATVDKNPDAPKDPTATQAQLDWIKEQLSSSRFYLKFFFNPLNHIKICSKHLIKALMRFQ